MRLVEEIPQIKRGRGASPHTLANTVAMFLLQHPNHWVEVAEVDRSKRNTLSNRRKELLKVPVQNGEIQAATRLVDGKVKLFARLDTM